MNQRSASKKVVSIAIIGAVALLLAIGLAIYGMLNPDMAGAEGDTMTDMMDPAEQAQASEIASEEIGQAQTEEADATEARQDSAQSSSKATEADDGADKASSSEDSSSSGATAVGEASSNKTSPKTEISATEIDKNAEADSNEKADTSVSATVYYFEYADPDDPESVPGMPGVRLLGQREIDGLNVGEQINAWDYVVNIPDHFFWDGWPRNLTIGGDSSQNYIELYYMRLYDAEYTVNYYVLTGADFTADSWSEALATGHAKFTKIGSETFTDQPINEIVKGDAYEYKLDNMYVIDSYPAQIRLCSDADNNVINVLYTPSTATLPDEIPVPDFTEGDNGGSGEGDAGGEGSSGADTNTPGDIGSDEGADVTLPGDETVGKDDLITLLPGSTDGSDDSSDSITDDFLGSPADRGDLQITDDLLTHPISQDQATNTLDVYKTGQHAGSLAQTGDALMPVIWVLIGIACASAVALIIVFARRAKTRTNAE